ncbi:MAG: hypothetical protein DWQ04_11300 [Chloroflexi bacterium]|nr:MAG: hypothetical protein DWQ04_11300 [Chloroflexota bacterium]
MTNSAKNKENKVHKELWSVATAVRDARYTAAVAAYENARMDGLCHDGAWECALAAMRSADFTSIVTKVLTEK